MNLLFLRRILFSCDMASVCVDGISLRSISFDNQQTRFCINRRRGCLGTCKNIGLRLIKRYICCHNRILVTVERKIIFFLDYETFFFSRVYIPAVRKIWFNYPSCGCTTAWRVKKETTIRAPEPQKFNYHNYKLKLFMT